MKYKAILFEDNPNNREHCLFYNASPKDKEAIRIVCDILNITKVYITDTSSVEDNVPLKPFQISWSIVPLEEALKESLLLYNMEWFLSLNFLIKAKKKAQAVCSIDSRFISKLPLKLLQDKKFILPLCDDPNLELRNSFNIMSDSGYIFHSIQNALDFFSDDREVALASIKSDPLNYIFISPFLKRDKEIVLEAIKKEPQLLEYVGDQFKDDYDVVIQAYIEDPESTLPYMSDRLKIMFFWGSLLYSKGGPLKI
jgi:hypothetical protein